MLTAPGSISGLETAWQARVSAELLESGARTQAWPQNERGDLGVCRHGEGCCRAASPAPASPKCLLHGLLLERDLRDSWGCRGVFRGEVFRPAHCHSPGEAAEVPRLQGALHRPQDDAEEDDDERREEDDALPVVAHVAAGQPPRQPRRGSLRAFRLAHGNVDGDARVWVLGVVGRPAAAELGPFHPEHLLLLELRGQRGKELLAGLESWDAFQRDAGQLAAEGAGELVLGVVWGQPFAQASHALQAENVGALEQFGRLKGVVVGVEANGTFNGGGRLRGGWVWRAWLVGGGPRFPLAVPWGGDNDGADGDGGFIWRRRDGAGGRVRGARVPQLGETRHDGARGDNESPGRLWSEGSSEGEKHVLGSCFLPLKSLLSRGQA